MTMLAAPDARAQHHRPRRRPSSPRENGRIDLRVLDEEQLAQLAEELCGSPVPGVRMTEQEFVAWSFDRVDAEWVDGEVILMAPANTDHETLDEWFGRLVGQFVEKHALGQVLRNVFVRFARQRRRRVPDLLVITTANLARVKPTFIDGAPDVAIEIVSPDSRNRDRRDKFLEYQAAGVAEYWIIDPLAGTVDLYVLVDGKYREVGLADGRLRSAVLKGFYLRPIWLFGGARPKVAAVLKEFAAARARKTKTKTPRRAK
jgi:Uma2 family endonuclease